MNMAGLDVLGVALVVIAVVYAFWKKHDRVALALVIVLLVLLVLLGYL